MVNDRVAYPESVPVYLTPEIQVSLSLHISEAHHIISEQETGPLENFLVLFYK